MIIIWSSSSDRRVIRAYDYSGWANAVVPISYEGVQYVPV